LDWDYSAVAFQEIIFFNKKKVKRCQEQIFRNYWMQVFILDT
jgi:hypothetical protein